MDWVQVFAELWQHHRGKIIGVALGLLLGIAVITWGFFKALFIALCVFVGLVIGKAIDRQISLKELAKRIFSDN